MATKWYKIVLRDVDGYVIGAEYEECGLKSAKERARYLVSDAYAVSAETTHETLRSDVAQVIDAAGDVIWDVAVIAAGRN